MKKNKIILSLIILSTFFAVHAKEITKITSSNLETKVQAATPSTNPASGYCRPYMKADGFYYVLDSAGTESRLTPYVTEDKATMFTSPTFTGTVTFPSPFVIGVTSVTATGTEINYLSGVDSNIQTQLDGKQAALGFTAVPDTRTINGHALNANVTLDADDLSDGASNAIITQTQEANFETAYTHSQTATGNPHSVTKSDIGLGYVGNVLNKLDATVAPGVNDDSGSGYSIGSSWFDITANKVYACLDASTGAAVWIETTAGASGGEANTASNVGAGTGLFYQKLGVDLQFKTFKSSDGSLTFTDDTNELDTKLADTIPGTKTFSNFPVTPSNAPTTDYQVANKKYVDDNAGGSPGGADTYIQFNNAGAFGGSANLTWNGSVLSIIGSMLTNTIAEKTAGTGVTIDGCLIKDGAAADVNISSMTAEASPASGMHLLIDDAGTRKKVDWSNLPGASGGETNTASNTGTSGLGIFKQKSTYDLIFYKIYGSGGISTTMNGTDFIDVKLNITGLTEETSPASGDYFVMYDTSASAYKKVDSDNMPGSGGSSGGGNPVLSAVSGFANLQPGTDFTNYDNYKNIDYDRGTYGADSALLSTSSNEPIMFPMFTIPTGTTSLKFRFRYTIEDGNTWSSESVVWKGEFKKLSGDNVAWGSVTAFTIGTDTMPSSGSGVQTYEVTISLTTLGLAVGDAVQLDFFVDSTSTLACDVVLQSGEIEAVQ